MTEFCGQLSAVSLRLQSISTLNELSDAMECASKAMVIVSSKLDTNKLRNMARTMAKEDAKLDMKSEMMNDILDDMNEGIDSPEQEEEVYKQVLADVGLEVDKILPDSAGGVKAPAEEEKTNAIGDDDLDNMLKSLQK